MKSNQIPTERRAEILNLLAERLIMTSEQIEYLHPEYGSQKRSRSLLNRSLKRMHEYYLIDRACYQQVILWDDSVKRTTVVALGKLGSEAVNFFHHRERIRYEDGKPVLSQKVHHIIQVNNMEIVIREVAKELGWSIAKTPEGEELWFCEAGNRIVRHENKLNPDVYAIFQNDRTGDLVHTFFEYDTGSEDRGYRHTFPKLSKKFDMYKEVKEWKDWYKNPITNYVKNPFPDIFFVTEEKKRFPEFPRVLKSKKLDVTCCLKKDFETNIREYFKQMEVSDH